MNNADLENKIKSICHGLVNDKGLISTIDVLLNLQYLSKADLDAWRLGKVPYLEKVCKANLSKLSTVGRAIRKVSEEMKLTPSWTAYNKYGKGVRKRLIFSKSGNENIEKLYATHYVRKAAGEKSETKAPTEGSISGQDTL